MREYLAHHGVLGQRWGVRRYQNPDGTLTELGRRRRNEGFTLPKGTTVGRITTDPDDKTYDNKKYVSITNEDHAKWNEYLGGANAYNLGKVTFQVYYDTVKDIKVAGIDKQTELYGKMFIDKNFAKQAKKDQEYADEALGQKKSDNLAENISRQVAMQTKTGHEFINKIMAEDYDAILDTHGTNTAELPVIILNPEKNLKKEVGETTYSDFSKKFLSEEDVPMAVLNQKW